MTATSPPAEEKHLTYREARLKHIENTINRSGPEVVAALNRSLPCFEDLMRARGPFKDLCFLPEFERGSGIYVSGTGDPAIEAIIDRLAHNSALATAKIVQSDEEYARNSNDDRTLRLVSMDRQKALGHSAVPRDPVPPLSRRMTVEVLAALVHGAVEGLLDPARAMVEKVPGSLKKLTAFRITLPAGPLLQVIFVIQFESRKVWASAVGLTRPDMLAAPLISLGAAVDPANEFAWPKEMPTETRIACCLRALALFAAQIARQSDTDPAPFAPGPKGG